MAGPDGRIGVLLVTHSLSGGGAERFASTLAGSLDRERFAPAVCAVTDRTTYPLPDDVTVARLRYRRLADLPAALLRLRRVIAGHRPRVVLSNVLSTNCLTGGALACLARRRRPAWVARIGNAPEVAEPPLQRRWARAVYPLAHTLVTNSRRMQQSFEARYPAARGRTRTLPTPTDFALLDRLAAEPPSRRAVPGTATVAAAGRLTRQKRPDLLLAALARVRERLDARLWLCGDGPLRPALEAQAAALGLGGAVELLGFCDNPFPLLRQADLFVLTSDHEGLPNALIEAQGLGVPAVATRCPYGPDEVIADGVTGRLVAVGDAAAIAEAMVEILADPEARRGMGAAAAERTRRLFDLPRALGPWQELLAAAAGG